MDSLDVVIVVLAIVTVGAIVVAIILSKTWLKLPIELTLAEVQAGQHNTGIVLIEGTGQTIVLFLYIRNGNEAWVRVLSPRGTIVEPADWARQKMITARLQSFDIAPLTTEKVRLDAICLEAHKLPPSSGGGEDYQVGEISSDDSIFKLFRAVDKLEKEIAKTVVWVRGDRFLLETEDDDLRLIGRFCKPTPRRRGKYQVRILGFVIQCALWQLTDGLSLEDYVRIIRKEGSEVDLVLVARAANVILNRAKLRPSMLV